MSNLTPRGWVVLVIIPTLLLVWGLIEVSTNLWWTGKNYCWGEYLTCYESEGK